MYKKIILCMLILSAVFLCGCQQYDDKFILLEMAEMQKTLENHREQMLILDKNINTAMEDIYTIDSYFEIVPYTTEEGSMTISKTVQPCSSSFLVDDESIVIIAGTEAHMESDHVKADCCCMEEMKSSSMCFCRYR